MRAVRVRARRSGRSGARPAHPRSRPGSTARPTAGQESGPLRAFQPQGHTLRNAVSKRHSIRGAGAPRVLGPAVSQPSPGPAIEGRSVITLLLRAVYRCPPQSRRSSSRLFGQERQHERRRAIPVPGPFPGSHAPPIGQLRVARRPNRPPSGPLRAFQPQRHTPSTPLRRFQAPLPPRAPQRHLQHRSNAGRSVDDMARHPPHRCRIARNPTPVHSALGERLTYGFSKSNVPSPRNRKLQRLPVHHNRTTPRDDQPRPRSLTTTSHPRVSGVLRYAGDRSGQPAHQYRVHGAAAGSGRALFDGRSRSLSGQCVHQAVFIKRLWRSLKYEAVYLRQLADGFMAQRVIDEWSSSPTRCDRARHSMVGRQRPSTAGSRRPDRRWRSGHGEQVAIAGSDRGPAGAQSGKGGYPQCPQDQAPLPRTSTPFYRHLFLTARGALTITRIYLDLPPGGEPNLPLPTSIEMTPDASAVVTFHRNHWKGSPEYAHARYVAEQVANRIHGANLQFFHYFGTFQHMLKIAPSVK